MKNSFLENLNQGVLGLKPYEPGLPLEHTQKKLGLEKMIKLASNENPLGPSPKALDLLQGKMNSFSSELNRYPDGNAYELKEAISKKYNVDLEQITIGNGSNDLIEFVSRCFLGEGKKAIYSQHGFAIYPLAIKATGAIPVKSKAKNWGHDLELMSDLVDDKTKVIFMDNDIEEQGTRERLESGISFIPEDRQLQAMIMDMNLTNNVIIGRQNIDKYKSSLGTMKMKNAVNESEKVISSFDVKTPGTSTLATALSGGNQQKFVVGRELEDNPSLLIASQPTRGIDIGAQALIWEKLRNSRDEGLSVLLISADLEELIGLSDRIIVFYQGKLVKELDAEKVTPEDLGGYMTGLKK